jgi:hypothetical protein
VISVSVVSYRGGAIFWIAEENISGNVAGRIELRHFADKPVLNVIEFEPVC